MIKAIFFDLFQTLVRYDPPREELVAQVLKDFGFDCEPGVFSGPLISADEFIYREIARRPLSLRSREEQTALYAEHQRILLTEAGIKADDKLVEVYKKAGVEVVTMTAEQAAKWRAIADQTSYKNFAEKVKGGRELLDMALSVE